MFRSSSTTSALVLAACSCTGYGSHRLHRQRALRWRRFRAAVSGPAGRRWHLHWQADAKAAPLGRLLKLDAAAVRRYYPPGYRQPEPGSGCWRAPPPGRLEGREGNLRRHPAAVVENAYRDPGRSVSARTDADPGPGRIVPERVVQQVHEDLLE